MNTKAKTITITIREPGSMLTHLIGVILSILAFFPMLTRAAKSVSHEAFMGIVIYLFSLLLLYLASTIYHSVNICTSRLNLFRKIDHMMIFVLIAGSYTPICLITLHGRKGIVLLVVIWCLAAIGMIGKYCWITCPKWFSSAIYISMGWVCVFVFRELIDRLPHGAFVWLLAGGIIYTAGGIIYALKVPLFRPRENFGNHEVFHLFVLTGSLCHFISIYHYLIAP